MSSIGESKLEELLAHMSPLLAPEEFVFTTTAAEPEGVNPLCRFREAEGVTSILPREDAERLGLEYTYPCRKITLQVHSSLDAIGFLAKITAELARNGISTNVVSAYFHDHLFVPAGRVQEALQILNALAHNPDRLAQNE